MISSKTDQRTGPFGRYGIVCSSLIGKVWQRALCTHKLGILIRLNALHSVRLRKGATAKECFLHLVSMFPLYTACPSLNALSYLCYAGVVDLEKGERRIGLLP